MELQRTKATGSGEFAHAGPAARVRLGGAFESWPKKRELPFLPLPERVNASFLIETC